MKVYEERVRPAQKERVCVERQCDLCGTTTQRNACNGWDVGMYDENDTQISIYIKHKEGKNYPGGGSGEEIEIDLCPDCFRNRLVVWLKEQGANIKYEEWDW